MQADEFFKLVDNPEFISGIYNYCDRWCEKCNYVNRCTVGTLEQLLQFGQVDNEPISADEFTGMLEIATGKSIDPESIQTITMDVGFDESAAEDETFNLLNNLPESEEESAFMNEMREAQMYVDAHDLNKVAHEYTVQCFKWKTTMRKYFLLDDTYPKPKFIYCGPVYLISKEDSELAAEAFEVIDWFSMLIAVKLKRALHSFYTDNAHFEPDNFQTDFNGSSKVAVNGMSRCLIAYQHLQLYFPSEYQSTVNIIKLLEELKLKTYVTFPCTDNFIRIGFDQSEV